MREQQLKAKNLNKMGQFSENSQAGSKRSSMLQSHRTGAGSSIVPSFVTKSKMEMKSRSSTHQTRSQTTRQNNLSFVAPSGSAEKEAQHPGPGDQSPNIQSLKMILSTLNQMKHPDQISPDGLYEILLKDQNFQNYLNAYRIANDLDPVLFQLGPSMDQLVDQGVSMDQLLECIKHIRIQEQRDEGDDEEMRKRHEHLARYGFNEQEGVNQLVYEVDHDYLKDMQTQQKKKYFPPMTETSKEFSQLHFPASTYCKQMTRLAQESQKAKTMNKSQNFKAQYFDLSPAGIRIPQEYRLK